MKKIPFTLADYDRPGDKINGEITLNNTSLSIRLDGFGTFDTEGCAGTPIWLEMIRGKVQLLVFDDIKKQDPKSISIEKARTK